MIDDNRYIELFKIGIFRNHQKKEKKKKEKRKADEKENTRLKVNIANHT